MGLRKEQIRYDSISVRRVDKKAKALPHEYTPIVAGGFRNYEQAKALSEMLATCIQHVKILTEEKAKMSLKLG